MITLITGVVSLAMGHGIGLIVSGVIRNNVTTTSTLNKACLVVADIGVTAVVSKKINDVVKPEVTKTATSVKDYFYHS